ncbi:MAG TPA: hypothetical protein VFW66_13150 [Gemmatimonadales bacterium]|nr:hypothetical protein [Gemmatimonadales bacterium]
MCVAPVTLAAQDTSTVRVDSARADSARVDSLRSDSLSATAADTAAVRLPDSLGVLRVSPGAALWRSLLLPGWGQLKLGHHFAAGFFIAAEAVTLGMSIKTSRDLSQLRQSGADSVTIDSKSQSREDWLVLLAVNHLLAGLEAFVAAHLSDFPAELKLRRTPRGMDAGFSLPVRVP